MRAVCILVSALVMLACSNDSGVRNPFLPEIGFRFEINLNLPLYSPLTNAGNAVYIGNQGVGVRGAFVINTGFNYVAFEASCPNHTPNSCSTLELNGQTAECPCEGYQYSLFTGQQLNRPDDGQRYYDLLNYRASQSGNVVVISN